MRFVAALLMFVAVFVASAAWAGDEILPITRTVEWRIVEPCDVEVASGEVTLNWADCGGAFEVVSIEYEDYPHPISLLFFAGAPDWSTLDPHVYASFFCNKCCTTKRPDVYCADCNPCRWYCYYTEASWCCETVCVYAYLPSCMALDIRDIY